MATIQDNRNEPSMFSKPVLMLPIFALLIIISIFIPRILHPANPSTTLSLWRRPDVDVEAFVCNETLYMNITYRGNGSLRVLYIVVSGDRVDVDKVINGSMELTIPLEHDGRTPHLVVLRLSYMGRDYSMYVPVTRECYKP